MEQESGFKAYYLGKFYPIYTKVDETIKKINIEWDGKSFICTSPMSGEIDIAGALQAFYTRASKKIIEERLRFYQPQVKVKYKSFSIENDSRRWGSCNSNKHLTFHWKLAMYPLHAIDYVVVHELCHLMHLNHDRSFWRLLGKIYPNYKEAMDILGTEKTRDM